MFVCVTGGAAIWGRADGQKADVWALGCVLYEVLALRPAFTANSMSALMTKIRNGQYVRALPSAYSEDLRQLVFAMLAPRPEDRPSTAELARHPLLAAYFPACDDAAAAAAGDGANGVAAAVAAVAAAAAAAAAVAAAQQAPRGSVANYLGVPPLRYGVPPAGQAPLGGLPAISEQPEPPRRRESEAPPAAYHNPNNYYNNKVRCSNGRFVFFLFLSFSRRDQHGVACSPWPQPQIGVAANKGRPVLAPLQAPRMPGQPDLAKLPAPPPAPAAHGGGGGYVVA